MPHFKCHACHHEWDGAATSTACDWCGADEANILELTTTFESFVKDFLEGDLRPVPHPGPNPGEGATPRGSTPSAFRQLRLLTLHQDIAYVETGSMEALDLAVGAEVMLCLNEEPLGLFEVLDHPRRSMQLMDPPQPTSRWFVKVRLKG